MSTVTECTDSVNNDNGTAPPASNRTTIDDNFVQLTKTFLKRFGISLLVYLMGHYRFSIAWIIVGLIVYILRERYRKAKEFKLQIARAAAVNEKASILARVEDLPSWVYFPDTERAEWINKILLQMWPYIGHYVKEFLTENVEPMVHSALKSSTKFGSFKFAKIDLGDMSPRIGGVKVYREHVARNEIIMDLELFYAGDCNIEVWVSKLRAGIKDVQLHGTARVIMKPLITDIPLVGGLQIFFLNTPVIDFNLTNVADVLDLPGLGDILRKVVSEQVSNFIVLPNKITVKMSDAVPTKILRFSQPAGVVRINVIEASDLMKKDVNVLGFGKSDPYAIITVGAQEFRTKVINNTINPVWDFYCEAVVDQVEGQTIDMEFFDNDQSSDDDSLGRLTVDVQTIASKGQTDLWIPLEDAKSGQVHLNLTWMGLSSSLLDLCHQQREVDALKEKGLSTALLLVYVDSAKGLPGAGKGPVEPCPLVRLTLGTQKQETSCQRSTNDPVWEQSFIFSVVNPDVQELYIDVVDMKTAKSLGNLAFNISRLLQVDNLELDQPFHLKNSGPQSKIVIHIRLRILKSGVRVPLDIRAENSDSGRSRTNSESCPESARSSPARCIHGSPVIHCDERQQGGSSSRVSESLSMVKNAVLDSVDANPNDTVRRRNVLPGVESTHGLGQVQLTLRFSQQRNRLIVVVHKVVDLPIYDINDPPDPYVKMYLQPDKNRDSKRKTQVVKNSCNPVYDETFEYTMSQSDLVGCQLLITVNGRSSSVFGKTNIMGQILIDLPKLDLSKALTEWYHLAPAETTTASTK